MATTPYLDLEGLKELSLIPDATLDVIDGENPDWFEATLVERSAWINARLSKRYAVPFKEPFPEVVQGWLARIVTWRATFKHGYIPTDLSAEQLKLDSDEAYAEIKEAADAVGGLFELPLRSDTDAGGVSRGGPLASSQASPYIGFDLQGARARDEDASGRGTGDGD